jgi:hypothetical protein
MRLFHIRRAASARLQSVQNAADSRGGGFQRGLMSFIINPLYIYFGCPTAHSKVNPKRGE